MDSITVVVPIASDGTGVLYVPVPCRCVILRVDGAYNADIGDNMAISFKKGSTEVLEFDLGADISIGECGTGVLDATNGQTIFDQGDTIKIDTPNATAAGTAVFHIWIDKYLSGVPGT